jgi:hypothetical protein
MPVIHPLLSRPTFWMLCQPPLLACWLGATGRLTARIDTDTATYQHIPLQDLPSALSATRTLGYPLFLRLVEALPGGVDAVPYWHLAAHVAASWLLCFGLLRIGVGRAASVAAASAVLWGKAAFDYLPIVLADSLALSFAVAAIGALLWVLGRPRSSAAWTALMLLTAAAYHTRPAYLFLLPLVPSLGWLLSRFVLRQLGTMRACGGFVSAAWLPWLGWCGLRWLVVGHFGLVSFGGYNLIGVTGQYLDEPLAAELSSDLQPVARRALEIRDSLPGWEPPADYYAMERMYNSTVWQIFVPAAGEEHSGDPVAVNRTVGAIAREIAARRPADYFRWLRWAVREGVIALLFLTWSSKPGLLCLAVLLACELRDLLRRDAPRPPPSTEDQTAARLARQVLVWTAVGFALAKLALVVLVEIPNHRYMTAAAVFLPALLAVLCVERCRRLRTPPLRETRPHAG